MGWRSVQHDPTIVIVNKSLCGSAAQAGPYFRLMRYQQCLMALLCGSLLLGACKKDTDTSGPHIEILAPSAGFVLQLPGQLAVSVRIHDDHIVESATISLLNGNGIPVAPSATATPGSSMAVIDRTLTVTSELLLSGEYTLVVRASDGTNESQAFQPIQLIEVPLRLRAAFVITIPTPSTVRIQRIDSTGSISDWAMLSQDFSNAAISSRDRRLLVAGGVSGPITALDAVTSSNAWQLPNTNGLGVPYFTAMAIGADDIAYSATNDDYIRGRRPMDGSQIFTAQTLTGFRASLLHAHHNVLFTVQRETGSSLVTMQTYSLSSGVLLDGDLLDLEVVAMASRDADHVLVFGNRSGDGVIQDRHVTSGSVWEPIDFPGTPIQAMAPMTGDQYALGFADGLRRYDFSTNSATPFGPAADASFVQYDPVSGHCWVAGDGQVQVVDPGSGMVLSTYPVADPIQELLLLFNR